MVKKLICALILVGSLSLVGCGGNSPKGQPTVPRFKILGSDTLDTNIELIRVKDSVTGEEFVIYRGHRKGGIVKVDKSGK